MIIETVGSILFFVVFIGVTSHLFNMLVFGRHNYRTKDEMILFPVILFIFMIVTLFFALILT